MKDVSLHMITKTNGSLLNLHHSVKDFVNTYNIADYIILPYKQENIIVY